MKQMTIFRPVLARSLPRYPIVPADMDDSRVVFLRRVAPVIESRF